MMYVILFVVSHFFTLNTCKCDNIEAKQKFNEYMDLVELRLKNLESNDNHIPPGLSEAVIQLSIVTKIDSESDMTYFGANHPTLNDFNQWKAWYEVNQDQLCWNRKKEEFWLKEVK